MTFQTVELTPRIGTEIRSDIPTLLSGEHAAEIRELLEQRGVLVFRELGLTDEQHLAFSKTLGDLLLQGGDELLNISLDRDANKGKEFLAEYLKGSWYWHIDQANADIPTRASLLTGRKLSDVGGDTDFANTYAAWDDLPEADKQAYEKLRVVHSLESSQLYIKPEPSLADLEGWRARNPSRTHPLVWTHKSGRKSLVLGATASYVVGMSPEESRYTLTRLRDWATRPEFVYRHHWKLGDLVIWDNTGTMHRATPYPVDSGRKMTRTTLKGEEALV
jgi:alpha-ketoglutarate-dependent taurine dioxygenase